MPVVHFVPLLALHLVMHGLASESIYSVQIYINKLCTVVVQTFLCLHAANYLRRLHC